MAARRRRRNGPGTAARPPAGGKAVKSPPASSDNQRAGGFELSEIRRLIRLVQRTGIGELELTSGGRTVRISAVAGTAAAPTAAPGAAFEVRPGAALGERGTTPTAGTAVAAAPENLAAVSAPMVGTFYRSPAPDADPYVEVGDRVAVGQTLCILEAMKLMNEIESEIAGKVVKILVENAQPVEFGQKLFLIDPS